MVRPTGTLTLHFQSHAELAQDISAVAVAGRTLFAACDETATVERLVRAADGDYRQEESIALDDHFELPEGSGGEMDIEGLAVDGDFLWITGSHSLKRDKPDLPSDDNAKALDELEEIDRDPNRYFLGRLPLVADRGGRLRPARSQGKAKDGAACLKMSRKGRNALTKVLHRDCHLAPSVSMPCKENGFDIEGLAARGGRVFLGLRGPVLSGWAVVVELELKASKRGRLKLRKIGAKGRRYLKHFLLLRGLGIRDLRFDGDDLLVLAGPTMGHDGTGALFRWRAPLGAEDDCVHPPQDVEHLMDLPYARGVDQAEGVAVVQIGNRRRLLIVHDSAAPARLSGDSLTADLFDLKR
jgi:Protein of unknown function (DUF3616)